MKKVFLLIMILVVFFLIPSYGQEEEQIDLLAVDGTWNLIVPLGQVVIYPVTGSTVGEIFVENLSPDILEIKTEQISNNIMFKGLKTGQATFALMRGGLRFPVYVSIREPAAILPEKVNLLVTGNPAAKDFLKDAALRSILSSATIKPKSYLFFDEYVPFDCPSFLARGETITFELPVRVESSIYFPVRTSVKVEVINKIVPVEETAFLMISNRPEKIEEDGILFKEELNPGKPVRLLFYHQNSPNSEEREFSFKLVNPSKEKAELKLISGVSGPSWDVFFVGHKSTERFLEDYATDSGQIITIPPKGDVTIFKASMRPGEVISGLVEMNILNNVSLSVITQAGTSNIQSEEVLSDEFNLFSIHPKGIFPNPNIKSEHFYNAGDEDLIIPVGVSPWLLDLETGAPDQGNYGAIYKFNIILSNFDGEERSIKFYFAPVNGVARGVFVINDILYNTELIRPGKLSLINEIKLAPKERMALKIFTTPQSASYYPVKLIVRSD